MVCNNSPGSVDSLMNSALMALTDSANLTSFLLRQLANLISLWPAGVRLVHLRSVHSIYSYNLIIPSDIKLIATLFQS